MHNRKFYISCQHLVGLLLVQVAAEQQDRREFGLAIQAFQLYFARTSQLVCYILFGICSKELCPEYYTQLFDTIELGIYAQLVALKALPHCEPSKPTSKLYQSPKTKFMIFSLNTFGIWIAKRNTSIHVFHEGYLFSNQSPFVRYLTVYQLMLLFGTSQGEGGLWQCCFGFTRACHQLLLHSL